MPRKSVIPYEIIIEKFLDHKELFATFDELPFPSHILYQTLSNLIQSIYPASNLAIYTWFYHNRFGLRDILFAQANSDHDEIKDTEDLLSLENGKSSIKDSSSESDYDPSPKSDSKDSRLNFELMLNDSEWRTLYPQWVHHKHKKGTRLRMVLPKQNWTGLLSRKFYAKTKLPCCISFNGNYVSEGNVTFKGSCKFCKSKLTGRVVDKKLMVEYSGLFKQKHPVLKRRLSGLFRKEIVDELRHISSTSIQKKLAHSEMNDGDFPSPNVPNLVTLRVAKSEILTKGRVDNDPIVSIYKLKYAGEYQNVIQDIGLDKFYVHYFSHEQINVYNKYIKSTGNASQFALDATGGVVRKIRRPSGDKCHSILLYDISIHNREINKLLSVGNMLSERHDTASISHFLQQWKRSGALAPKTIVCDMSLALMAACVQAFSDYSTLKAYLNNCAHILNDPEKFVRPSFYLKNDVAHVVKLFTRFPSLRNSLKRTKEFYLRSLCLVLQEKDIAITTLLLELIFSVALYETEGELPDGNPTKSEVAKTTLKRKISTSLFPTTLEENTEIDAVIGYKDEEEVEGSENVAVGGFKEFVENIKKRVELDMNDDGDRNNQQYLPDLVTDFIKIAHLLPTFSAIMVPYFGFGNATSSSSANETQFSILKNHGFELRQLPARIDDFLVRHIEFISGSLKIDHYHHDFNDSKLNRSKIIKNEFQENPKEESKHESDMENKEKEAIEDLTKLDETFVFDPKLLDTNRTQDIDIDILINSTIFEKCNQPEEIEQNIENKGTDREENELHYLENWKGINEGPLKKRNRTSYLEPNKEFEYLDLSNCQRTKSIGLLKNGNSFKLKPIKIDQKLVILKNTCGFDSVLQIFCAATCDSLAYIEFAKSRSQDEFYALILDVITKGVTFNTYKRRAQLLDKLFEAKELCQNLFLLDTVTSMDSLICKLFNDINNKIELCSPIVTGEEIQKCFESNDIHDNDKRKHLIIEVLSYHATKLCEIPKSLKSPSNQILYLRGVVAYQGNYSVDIGHFVGYSLRPNNQFEVYDDLKDKSMGVSGNKEVQLQLILYTV